MTDFFDDVLNLEETAYQSGFATGSTDGATAGLVEGRIFGLEKGYERFKEIGRLQGRAAVWSARTQEGVPGELKIENPRAQKNVQQLELLLMHPPFKNEEEEVEEVEETLKRGRAKVKVLERILGEKGEPEERGETGQAIEI